MHKGHTRFWYSGRYLVPATFSLRPATVTWVRVPCGDLPNLPANNSTPFILKYSTWSCYTAGYVSSIYLSLTWTCPMFTQNQLLMTHTNRIGTALVQFMWACLSSFSSRFFPLFSSPCRMLSCSWRCHSLQSSLGVNLKKWVPGGCFEIRRRFTNVPTWIAEILPPEDLSRA